MTVDIVSWHIARLALESKYCRIGTARRIQGDADHHGKKENCSEEKGSQQQEGPWEKESGKEARDAER